MGSSPEGWLTASISTHGGGQARDSGLEEKRGDGSLVFMQKPKRANQPGPWFALAVLRWAFLTSPV